jgi:hypothetical protein
MLWKNLMALENVNQNHEEAKGEGPRIPNRNIFRIGIRIGFQIPIRNPSNLVLSKVGLP